jgi:predicted RNase H-like nuclease (RuvC/YqgF family)
MAKERAVATLRHQITGLQKRLEEKEMEKEQVEAPLRRQITDLEVSLEENYREKGQMEMTLRGHLEEQMETFHAWMTEFLEDG